MRASQQPASTLPRSQKIKPNRAAAESSTRFINRDLSWLDFNQRVIDESRDTSQPLLERVRFLSIAANNLDEFYMTQVAAIRRQIEAGITVKSVDGHSPAGALAAVTGRVDLMLGDMRVVLRELLESLRGQGIEILAAEDLSAADIQQADAVFEREIFPILSPLAINPGRPFPYVPNRGLAVAAILRPEIQGMQIDGVVIVPSQLRRFVRLGNTGARYVAVERLIRRHLPRLFPGHTVIGSGIFRIVRDSDLDIAELDMAEDAEHLLESFETVLQRRLHGEVVRLSASEDMPDSLFEFLMAQLNAPRESSRRLGGMIGVAGIRDIIQDHPDLQYRPYTPRLPERLKDFDGDCFSAIRAKDIIVHHPYESFDVVVQFLRQAARDPAVVAIKQTLYRTSANSPIVEALVEAAEAGKSVTAVVEIKARFDEEANLRWARDLEKAGAQVTFGFSDLKIHAKLSLVLRREGKGDGLVPYAHLGTGNYHPLTARVYTDLSLFTCDEAICDDTARLFNYMTSLVRPESLKKLVAAPMTLRATLVSLIAAEADNARQGLPAEIWLKLNGLTDPGIIDALYAASGAGVKIMAMVRGMCALRPGVPGLSETIRVRSLIGRYLEHARIVCFANGAPMPSPQARVFMSSADWMPRNLDHRIETLVPLETETVRQQVMDQIMVANLNDKAAAWELHGNGQWRRVCRGETAFSAQDYFMNHPSLSGRGSVGGNGERPPRLKVRRR